jgi:hypothetical protein
MRAVIRGFHLNPRCATFPDGLGWCNVRQRYLGCLPCVVSGVVLSILLASSFLISQEPSPPQPLASSATSTKAITIPAGTKVPLVLKHAVTTRSARVGDGIYLQTNFPVTVDNQIVIPPGTYVQGVIDEIKRPGRLKGRAQVLFHFTTLIFPSGYTVSIPGSVESVPGMERSQVKDKEGTLEAEGQKGQDAATVAEPRAQERWWVP